MEKRNIVFLKGILSGIIIGLAGVVYITTIMLTGNKFLGGLLFSFALLLIVARDYALYTGRIGYLLPYKKGYLVHIIEVLLGNIVGVAIMGLLLKFTGLNIEGITLVDKATEMLNYKTSLLWYQTFILSIFCGILMYVAVDTSKNIKSDIFKVVLIIGAVTLFLVSGFEHSIANIFYMFLGNAWSFKLILYIFIMLIGNATGAVIINLIHTKINQIPIE